MQLRIEFGNVENVSFHGSDGVFPTFLQEELSCEVGLCLTELLNVLELDTDVPVQDDLHHKTNTNMIFMFSAL